MNMTAIIIMSVLIEAIITYIKTWMVERRVQWQMVVSVVLSIAICIAYGLDLPAAVGVESSLPFSVRKRAEKIIAPEAERLRRLSMITAQHRNRDSGCFVTLAMSDGKGEIIRLNILSSGEQQAERIEENFRDRAEELYCKIIELLDKKPENKKG